MTTVAPEAAIASTGPNQGRYVVTAVLVCVAFSFLVVTGALYFFYQDAPTALGVGLFVSFWGGGGFGIVGGIAAYNLRLEALAKGDRHAA